MPTILRLLNEVRGGAVGGVSGLPSTFILSFLQHLAQFELSPMFQSVEEVEYWLTPRSNIITCYVVEVSLSTGTL